jgi:hypothetical protein
MPHWVDSLGVDRGLYWQNHFADGPAMLAYLRANLHDIMAEAGGLQALLNETDLPQWMRDRLCNCCYPLVTNSVLYRDGRFSINEGPTEMSGCYGTIDQRLGAHPATQLLFPALNAQELREFAAILTDEGGVNHDLGGGHLENGPMVRNWPDLNCSFAIQHARHAWTTGDNDFETESWPKVRRAMLQHAAWAEKGKGVAQLGELGTSYDSYHYIGTTAYMGTLWIAALLVCRKWAERAGDQEFLEKIPGWIDAAQERLETDLWNGRFYRAYASPGNPTNENSHGGMLAGEYFARMLAGQDVLPPERLSSCADALMELQGGAQFAVPPDEVAPDGSVGSLYGWLPYIESFCLAPAAVLGHNKVLEVWQRVVRHMDGGGKHPCDTRLMYRPQTGEQSWGAYYMTAPASWLVYDALLDFVYLPEPGRLRLNPQFDGSFALVHPLLWALGRKHDRNTLSVEIVRLFTDAELAVRQVEVPKRVKTLAVNGTPCSPTTEGDVYAVFAVDPVRLTPGATVEVVYG